MKEPNDDFLQHIKSTLRNHEEPYVEGAWERFSKMQNKPVRKTGLLMMMKWAAAAVVVAGGIFILVQNLVQNIDTKKNLENSTIATKEIKSIDPLISDSGINATHDPVETNLASNPENENRAGLNMTATSQTYINKNKNQISQTINNKELNNKIEKDILPEILPESQPKAVQKEKESLIAKNKESDNQIKKENIKTESEAITKIEDKGIVKSKSERRRRIDRWEPGLYISPILGDEGVNMGYGLSIAYTLNDRLKIRTGIAHTKVSASSSFHDVNSSFDAPGTFAENKTFSRATNENIVNSQQTSVLQQVNGSLSGFDIPFELNYMLTKKWYATAGISGLIVLDDKKNYTYLDSRNVKVSVQTSKGVVKENKSIHLNNSYQTSQAQLSTSNEAIPFLGFYNFSLGYKQKVFSNKTVSLEPFVKVPMKTNQQYNLNYTGTGIRLRFDF